MLARSFVSSVIRNRIPLQNYSHIRGFSQASAQPPPPPVDKNKELQIFNQRFSKAVAFYDYKTADQLWEELKEKKIQPDVDAFNTYLFLTTAVNRYQQGLDLFKQMKQMNVQPNLKTYSLLIEHYGTYDRTEDAVATFHQLKQTRLPLDTSVYISLMRAYSYEDRLEEAEKVIDNLLVQDGVKPDAGIYIELLRLQMQSESRENDVTRWTHYYELLKKIAPLEEIEKDPHSRDVLTYFRIRRDQEIKRLATGRTY